MTAIYKLSCFASIGIILLSPYATSYENANKGTIRHLQQFREQEPCRELDPSFTYFCPVNRYCEFMQLLVRNRNQFKEILGYDRREWDYLGRINTDIEYTRFRDLNSNQVTALEFIGFNEDSHDCCHGHYTAYDWADFLDDEYTDVKAAWELLGYDENNWVDIDAQNLLPPYGDAAWDDLPDDVRFAASNYLCYNKELWDGVSIKDWSNTTVLPGSFKVEEEDRMEFTESPSSVTVGENVTLTQHPSLKPSFVSDSPSIAILKEATSLPSSESDSPSVAVTIEPTPGPSTKPVMESTPKPSSDLSDSPTFTPITITEQPPCKELNENNQYFCPAQRYCEWDYFVDSTTQQLASILNYTEDSWNYNGVINDVELSRFSELEAKQRKMLEALGYDNRKHDCCLSHFTTFTWEELFTPDYVPMASALLLLGYTEENWDTIPNKMGHAPLFPDTAWDQLPRAVRFSARSLCYTREVWDQVALPWTETAIVPGSNERESFNRPTIPIGTLTQP